MLPPQSLDKLPQVLTSSAQLRQWRKTVSKTVGFVPTMGALHSGHAHLLRELQSRCEASVLSIFVNPTQFGPTEDFSRYPRPFESDLEIARQEGIDIVFAPPPEDIYPQGYSTYTEELIASRHACGEFRPGHFRGVTTVLVKLFNLVQPDVALFGLKDAQQFFVTQKLVQDLGLSVRVEGIPTVRESDGLALSSRNRYLSLEDRRTAPKMYEALTMAATALQNALKEGINDVPQTLAQVLKKSRAFLVQHGFRIQYFDCFTLPDFQPMLKATQDDSESALRLGEPCVLATAAYLGETRLIDNIILWRN